MFMGKDSLSVDKLLVKLRKWQLGWQHSVLDVEQPIVTRSKPTRFGAPCFCPRIRRVNADVNDLRNFEAPIAYDLESFGVPSGIGNDIDSYRYIERASKLQRLEILRERHTLAITLESILVDRFKADEH